MRIFLKLFYRILWLLFLIFPIQKNKVVFQSFSGRGFSDNPKYIAQKLHKKAPEIIIYWAANNPLTADLPDGIRFVKYKSVKYLYHMTTAKIWVDNIRKPFFIKKKGQYYLQTWHGGLGLKKVENDAIDKLNKNYIKWAKRDAKSTDLMLSSSKTLSEIFRNSLWYHKGEILEKGLPRNDLFFNFCERQKHKIKNRLGIKPNSKILLYAPTFRDDGDITAYDINFNHLASALKKRFGGSWVILVRLHPNISGTKLNISASFIKNVSSYNDIQELYIISDFLITDYSSSIFDFALTERPSLLYASDIVKYTSLRDFYFDFSELPFTLCQTNAELEKAVLNFDCKKHKKRLKEFKLAHGYCESGKASDYAAEWIINKCFNKERGKTL